MGKKAIIRDTGEIVEEPEFVKLYIKELCRVKGVTAVQARIFNFMLSNMNHKNIVSYGPVSKSEFLNDNNIKNQTFNNNITGLIKSGMIERIGRSEFRVNPRYAAKVEWHKVQSIKWETEYTKSGKKEKITFVENGNDNVVELDEKISA